jgi:hypothetical protein
MREFILRAAVRLALAVAAVLALTAPAGAQFVVEYAPTQDADAGHVREVMMQSGILGTLSESLNAFIRMPRRIPLRMMDCTSSDIRWNAEAHALELCYRMIIRMAGIAAEQDSLSGAVSWAHLYLTVHGTAHAIIDELDLPGGTDPEARVDELSAVLMMGTTPPVVSLRMLEGIHLLQQADTGWDSWAYATAHRLGPERFRNVACLLYGVNDGYAGLRQAGLVAAGAQQRCRTASLRMVDTWSRRLNPYFRRPR